MGRSFEFDAPFAAAVVAGTAVVGSAAAGTVAAGIVAGARLARTPPEVAAAEGPARRPLGVGVEAPAGKSPTGQGSYKKWGKQRGKR